MPNIGIAPPDFDSLTGQVRAILGDTAFTVVEPTPPDTEPTGLGEYTYFGDSELDTFLVATDDSLEGALALAYNSMATSAALEAVSIADFDLKIDKTKRSSELRALAAMWQGKADALTADIFEVFDISGRRCRCELAEGVSCRGCRGSFVY